MRAKRSEAEDKRSPAMVQFFRAKEQVPDALLFFRMGDFYELFHDDAIVAARALDLTLTSRAKSADGTAIPMAGVPHHAAAGYLARLVAQGFRVAICEQMADPATVRGIVPREIVRVVTPALALDPECVDERADQLLVGASCERGSVAHAAFDLTRGELRSGRCDVLEWLAEMARMEPREVLVEGLTEDTQEALQTMLPRARIAPLGHDQAKLPVGIELAERAIAERVLGYAQAAFPKTSLRVHIAPPHGKPTMRLDEVALRNLEVVRTLGGEYEGSLLHAVDRTRTAMGARLLRRRLTQPLLDRAAIEARLDQVEHYATGPSRAALRTELDPVRDLERVIARIETGTVGPRDLRDVRASLRAARRLGAIGTVRPLPATDVVDALLVELEGLEEELPLALNEGGLVRPGVDAKIDALRATLEAAQGELVQLEERERASTGIGSLKVGYTRVFGHYIEVTRTHLRSIPPHFRRKQTIANGERFTTEDLLRIEHDLEETEASLLRLEAEHFDHVRGAVAKSAAACREVASWLAELDVDCALAELAVDQRFVRPVLDESTRLDLVGCRHPVVEQHLPRGTFVPNDITLDGSGERMWIVTGPNMAGKSTTMREVALTVLLAQAGSFVPCTRAHLGLVDAIHTRVGASDNLARGQSTFMVEMQETARLLATATHRSLVILDEIGRGTSTYDGLAIARSVAEHLVEVVRCRALFATHYHELSALEAEHPRHIANVNVAAIEEAGSIAFLHQVVRGAASRSYGVAVARLAGLPAPVLDRAEALLAALEAAPRPSEAILPRTPTAPSPAVPAGHAQALRELASIIPDRLTPIEALVRLAALRRLVD